MKNRTLNDEIGDARRQLAEDARFVLPGLVYLDRLREHGLVEDIDDRMEWIVPPGILDGVTSAWGLRVRHVAGVDTPYLAYRLPASDTSRGHVPVDL